MNHLRPADLIVGRVAIGLQEAFEQSQKLLRSVASAAQTEVEHHRASGSAVLPQVGLMVPPSALVHLHVHRGFIGFDVTAAD